MAIIDWLSQHHLITPIIVMLVLLGTLLGGTLYLVLAERKISAYMQDRLGPNRVGFDFGLPILKKLFRGFGFWGLGQPLADGLKFLMKEDYTPEKVDKVLFTLGPALIIIPAITMRLLSEEQRSGTLEMMLTAPVNEWTVVLSKFLAAWFFFNFTTQVLEYLYMGMTETVVFINMGYQLASYLVAGVVLGLIKFGAPKTAIA